MNLKEWAEQEGITITEAKERTGLTHWNQTMPESCDEIEEVAETDSFVDGRAGTVINWKAKEEQVAEEVNPVADMKAVMAKSQEVMKTLMKDGVTVEQALGGIRLIGKKCKYFDIKDVLETLV